MIPLFDFSDRFNLSDIDQTLALNSLNGSESSNATSKYDFNFSLNRLKKNSFVKIIVVHI